MIRFILVRIEIICVRLIRHGGNDKICEDANVTKRMTMSLKWMQRFVGVTVAVFVCMLVWKPVTVYAISDSVNFYSGSKYAIEQGGVIGLPSDNQTYYYKLFDASHLTGTSEDADLSISCKGKTYTIKVLKDLTVSSDNSSTLLSLYSESSNYVLDLNGQEVTLTNTAGSALGLGANLKVVGDGELILTNSSNNNPTLLISGAMGYHGRFEMESGKLTINYNYGAGDSITAAIVGGLNGGTFILGQNASMKITAPDGKIANTVGGELTLDIHGTTMTMGEANNVTTTNNQWIVEKADPTEPADPTDRTDPKDSTDSIKSTASQPKYKPDTSLKSDYAYGKFSGAKCAL